MGSKELFVVLKVIRSSLHFASLSWNLSSAALVTKVSTAIWMVLGWFLPTVSKMVVSSTYFHSLLSGMSSSLIITMMPRAKLSPFGDPCWDCSPLREAVGAELHSLPAVGKKIDNPEQNSLREIIVVQFIDQYVMIDKMEGFLELKQDCPYCGSSTVGCTVPCVNHADKCFSCT